MPAGSTQPWPDTGPPPPRGRPADPDAFPEHFAVNRRLIAAGSITGLDLHIEVNGRLVLYRSGAQSLDEASIEKLQRRSVTEFWVRSDQSAAYGQYLSEQVASMLSLAETDAEAASILRDASRSSVRLMFERLDDAASFERLQRASELTVERLAADAAFMPQLLEFVGSHEVLLTRATNTAAYAIALAARQPGVGDSDLYDVGLGALLHDVGLAPLGPALDAASPLSEVEQGIAARHARRGHEALVRAGIDDAPMLRIVRDHHGTEGGVLPSVGVQAVALADQFDELTNQRGGPAVGPFAALYQMRASTGQVFSMDLLRDFVLMLGGVPVLSPHSPVAAVSRRTPSAITQGRSDAAADGPERLRRG